MHTSRSSFLGSLTLIAACVLGAATAHAQPNPYAAVDGWAKLPDGRTMGAVLCFWPIAVRA